jgi:hypothetical protein
MFLFWPEQFGEQIEDVNASHPQEVKQLPQTIPLQ